MGSRTSWEDNTCVRLAFCFGEKQDSESFHSTESRNIHQSYCPLGRKNDFTFFILEVITDNSFTKVLSSSFISKHRDDKVYES